MSIGRLAAALQLGLAAIVLLTIGFVPPAFGRTLLVPIDGRPVDGQILEAMLLRHVAEGPLPGSVVVDGIGRPNAAALIENGILMLAAPAVICGEGSALEGTDNG